MFWGLDQFFCSCVSIVGFRSMEKEDSREVMQVSSCIGYSKIFLLYLVLCMLI